MSVGHFILMIVRANREKAGTNWWREKQTVNNVDGNKQNHGEKIGQGRRPLECYAIRMYCNCPWSFSTQTATSTQCTKNVK